MPRRPLPSRHAGRRLTPAPQFESLECRRVLDAAAADSTWTIHGDADPLAPDDVIVVGRSPTSSGLLEATVNGVVVSTREARSVDRIEVFGGAGDDIIRVEIPGNRRIRAFLFGGDGDDALLGGDGNDRLHGGPATTRSTAAAATISFGADSAGTLSSVPAATTFSAGAAAATRCGAAAAGTSSTADAVSTVCSATPTATRPGSTTANGSSAPRAPIPCGWRKPSTISRHGTSTRRWPGGAASSGKPPGAAGCTRSSSTAIPGGRFH